jgi:outer membrane protein assembly factor BamA
VNKIQKICLYTSIIASSTLLSCYSIGDEIKKITITGNHRVEQETILSYLNLKVGDEINPQEQDKAVKNLYATSLFEDLKINCHDGELKLQVKEYPLITKVEFKGNSKIGSSTLKKETLTKIGSSVSKSTINADVVKIKELYKRQGKFLVNVEVKIQELKNNRAKVIFNFFFLQIIRALQILIKYNLFFYCIKFNFIFSSILFFIYNEDKFFNSFWKFLYWHKYNLFAKCIK